MIIPFAGGAYKTFSPNVNAEECVNFVPSVEGPKRVLRGTPGLKSWCDTGNYAEVRGMIVFKSWVYVVVGNTVYRINSNGGATACTGSLATSSGFVSMASSISEVMIVDGIYGYTVLATTVSTITDADFPSNPMTVTHQDGYFIITIEGSGTCYISDLNDGTSWDSSYYFNAEAKQDDSLAAFSFGRNILVFGSQTLERWYNSGSTVPFDRIPGTTQEVGIGARYSPAIVGNVLFYMTDKFQIVALAGNEPKIMSMPSIDYQIAQYPTKSDAIGMGVENIEGHSFYIITFPTANATWVYDLINKSWFQLKSYPEPFDNKWRGNCYVFFAGKHLVGDHQNGIIYEWDFGTYTDNDEYIRRVRVTSGIRQEGKNIFHNELQIFFEAGKGLVIGQGSDPQAMLSWSDDGGHTWGNEYWRDAGKIGEYTRRARWTRLGASRHRNYKLEVSDPVKWIIFEVNLIAQIGIN